MKRPEKHTYVDEQIARITVALKDHEVTSKEYSELLHRLGDLQKIRQDERPDRVSSDTLLMAGTNIIGILLIIRHEHLNVITSRAMNMISKTK